ncbi:SDR family NAD(P)-dependent oxidoreductase [Nitratidesulfovibrio sp. HK-II]|uniref:SDR family NAD(P)-dependent oxidoreductase n=1 Tax=Nitratidesulfovibrio sp. HK-II TaxID=2009266 RepID=UPI000E2E907D|nr:SDR family NAD(P)-dependent oxidoreductase [Nitratidesulfovibrio sp. HK-II]
MTLPVSILKNKHVLITGVCGTIGNELVRQILGTGALGIRGLDHNETGVFNLQEQYRDEPRFTGIVGNVADSKSVHNAMEGIDIVLHGAALKHVYLGERCPDEIINTNVHGVQNIIRSAVSHNVERVVFMSSDKAVNPTSIMGTSKLMGERLITAAQGHGRRTIFSATRFGNVLGSSGSVVPVLLRQIQNRAPLTLTDPDMTRFVMSRRQAVQLVLSALQLALGGEVFVTKMPVLRIVDLIEAVRDLYCSTCGIVPQEIPITVVGKRPGEKLYEELMSSEELGRAYETEDFFIVRSAFQPELPAADAYGGNTTRPHYEYRSNLEQPMPLDEVAAYLQHHNIIEDAEL